MNIVAIIFIILTNEKHSQVSIFFTPSPTPQTVTPERLSIAPSQKDQLSTRMHSCGFHNEKQVKHPFLPFPYACPFVLWLCHFFHQQVWSASLPVEPGRGHETRFGQWVIKKCDPTRFEICLHIGPCSHVLLETLLPPPE